MYDPLLNTIHESLGGVTSHLGHEYLLTDSGRLETVFNSQRAGGLSGSIGGASGSTSPTSTLVGSSKGLEIDLLWDASVRTASDWSAIESAVVEAATIYTSLFSNHIVLNIAVGFGEIDGSSLTSGALGESDSYGYIANYQAVESAMSTADSGLLLQHGSSSSVLANSALSHDNFFVSSSEAKALGLVRGTSSSVDGYIGLSSQSGLLNFAPTANGLKSGQYDAIGVVAHEISEVMGRIGEVGGILGGYKNVYTPLDLFRFHGARSAALTAGAADYFSLNDGATNLNTYNNPANGGDASDWASLSANRADAYDAFGNPGVVTDVTATDLLEVAALGYQVDAGATLATVTA